MAPSTRNPPSGTGYANKRARTQRALVRGAMSVMADTGSAAVTAAAVAKAARVSPSTLYNHYVGVDALEDAVADVLADVIELGADDITRLAVDPAGRVTLGILRLLAMPELDPAYARAFTITLSSRPAFRSRVRRLIGAEVAAGAGDGLFDTPSQAVATDALMGAVLQALESALAGETAGDPVAVATVCLRMLGMPPDDIRAVVQRVRSIDGADQGAGTA